VTVLPLTRAVREPRRARTCTGRAAASGR